MMLKCFSGVTMQFRWFYQPTGAIPSLCGIELAAKMAQA
jgi:predicted hotdog family 3-hydroxylacyl-ACP dehydratase